MQAAGCWHRRVTLQQHHEPRPQAQGHARCRRPTSPALSEPAQHVRCGTAARGERGSAREVPKGTEWWCGRTWMLWGGGQRTVLSLAIDCLTCNRACVTRMRNRARKRGAGACSRHFEYALGIGHITLIMRCGLGILARCARAQSRMVSKWLRSLSSTHHNPCSWSKFLRETCHASCVRVKRVKCRVSCARHRARACQWGGGGKSGRVARNGRKRDAVHSAQLHSFPRPTSGSCIGSLLALCCVLALGGWRRRS